MNEFRLSCRLHVGILRKIFCDVKTKGKRTSKIGENFAEKRRPPTIHIYNNWINIMLLGQKLRRNTLTQASRFEERLRTWKKVILNVCKSRRCDARPTKYKETQTIAAIYSISERTKREKMFCYFVTWEHGSVCRSSYLALLCVLPSGAPPRQDRLIWIRRLFPPT